MKQIGLLLVLLIGSPLVHADSTINSTNSYAWGANIGWTNWRPSLTDGVMIGEFICSGYIYGANVGWIHVGDGTPDNNIQYSNTSATDYGVNYGIDPAQPGFATLRGFAYGANIGWINFEAQGNPRVRFSDGALEGYAYSANCGWINLGDPTQHNLFTDTIAMGTDSDGDGIADAFEYQYFSGLGPTATSDSDGDGVSDLDEYLEGTNPTVFGDRLRIISLSPNSGGTSTPITWTSTTGRLYIIETTTDLLVDMLNEDWSDSSLGTITPDAGTQTTRTVTASSSTKRFFRVKAMRPLSP